MVDIVCLGGAGEIGASCTLYRFDDLSILVDAGARPGRFGEAAQPDFASHADDPVDAILITHGHHDHIGSLPIAHRLWPNAPIYATHPTHRIAETLLYDSIGIQERQGEVRADFTYDDVRSCVSSSRILRLNSWMEIGRTPQSIIRVRSIPAGHILGAVSLDLQFERRGTGETVTILHSGDVSLHEQATIPGLDLESWKAPTREFLVLEGTYGDAVHTEIDLEEARFVEQVADVVNRGGRVAVAAFAVGRAQNIVAILRRAQRDPVPFRKRLDNPTLSLPEVPILLDGLCRDMADIYDENRLLLSPGLHEESAGYRHTFFDDDRHVRRVGNRHERAGYQRGHQPYIAVSSSGMLSGGAIVGYVEAIADDPSSALLFTGYLDEDSPGSDVVRAARSRNTRKSVRVRVGDQRMTLRCDVQQFRLSGHSDADGLATLATRSGSDTVGLVHGDPRNLEKASRYLADKTGRNIMILRNGGVVSVKPGGEQGAKQKKKASLGSGGALASRLPDPHVYPGLGQLTRSLIHHMGSHRAFTAEEVASFWVHGARCPESVIRFVDNQLRGASHYGWRSVPQRRGPDRYRFYGADRSMPLPSFPSLPEESPLIGTWYLTKYEEILTLSIGFFEEDGRIAGLTTMGPDWIDASAVIEAVAEVAYYSIDDEFRSLVDQMRTSEGLLPELAPQPDDADTARLERLHSAAVSGKLPGELLSDASKLLIELDNGARRLSELVQPGQSRRASALEALVSTGLVSVHDRQGGVMIDLQSNDRTPESAMAALNKQLPELWVNRIMDILKRSADQPPESARVGTVSALGQVS